MGGPGSAKLQKEQRTEYERDYGRTIYSAPFRRLKHKAQVFPLEPGDFVRTRLLHSLEVSSVAEDLASQLVRTVPELKKLRPTLRDAIPVVTATCGLIHDLGNPPFGHAGELAISTWFEKQLANNRCFFRDLNEQQQQDFLRFEGNAHTLRIISRMFLIVDKYGLNYTCATFSAARKYLAPSNGVDCARHSHSKPGYFSSENKVVKLVEAKTKTGDRRNPLTLLVEAADDMVYCVVDLEDGIKRGILNWSNLRTFLENTCRRNQVFQRALDLAERQVKKAKFAGQDVHAHADAMAQTFRIAALSEMAIVAKEVFRRNYSRIMNGEYDGELVLDPASETRQFVDACKTYARAHLYTAPDILRLEVRGRKVIHDLMDLLWESVENLTPHSFPVSTKTYPGKVYNLISENYRRVFEFRLREKRENALYCKMQLVTDYVAGMTDPFACTLHKDMSNV